MTTKVIFSDRDEILAALVRAIAVQSGGFHMVGGMNKDFLHRHGFYRFGLDAAQHSRFKNLIA
jgi:hypothetical protein